MEISFEEVKQIFHESINDSANINELFQNVANKIYQKGFNDYYGYHMHGETEETKFCPNCGANLELLRKQVPAEPELFIDEFGCERFRCKCGAHLFHIGRSSWKYCPICGQAVKWS